MKISLKTASATSATKVEVKERKYVALSTPVAVTVIGLSEEKSVKLGNIYYLIEVEDADGGTHDGMLVNLTKRKDIAIGDKMDVVCTLTQIKGKWSRKVIV
jgi:hypothetical protein